MAKEGIEGIEEALQEETKSPEVREQEAAVAQETEDKRILETKEEDLNDTDKTKRAEILKAKQTREDPEIDIPDEKGNVRKIKLSQIKEWEKNQMLQTDYTKKTQELAATREQYNEMESILGHLKTNPKKAKKIIALLDMKEEDIRDEVEKTETKVDEIDEALQELAEDDPYAIVLRKTKERILKQEKALADLLKMNQDLQAKLTSPVNEPGAEKTPNPEEEAKAQEEAKQVLTKTLDDMVKGFDFVDDEDKQDWRQRILSFIVNNPKEYKDEADAVATIQEVGKKVYEAMHKLREKYLKRYLEKKGGPTTPSGGPGGPGGEHKQEPITMANLQEGIEAALKEEANKT